MTTLDVSVTGPQGTIDLSNGLLGPASTIFFGACDALRDGKATGTAGAAGCSVTMKGEVLLDLLPGSDAGLYQKHSSSGEQIRAFRDSVDPAADYRVDALEV